MAADFTIKQHDQLPELVVTLTDSIDSVVDVTGATVRFIMNVKGGDTVIDESAVIVDAVAGVVKYIWQDEDTATPGNYSGEFEVKFSDGREETFPNSTHIKIKIFPDLGGVAI